MKYQFQTETLEDSLTVNVDKVNFLEVTYIKYSKHQKAITKAFIDHMGFEVEFENNDKLEIKISDNIGLIANDGDTIIFYQSEGKKKVYALSDNWREEVSSWQIANIDTTKLN